MYRKGFTLIELLVVITIIGMLSSIVFSSLGLAKTRAKNATAQGQLHNVYTAIYMLTIDTDKWPGGCPPDQVSNPEIYLEDQWAGLAQRPPVGSPPNGGACQWTAAEVAAWNGPYIKVANLKDAWGTSYMFDPDYCDSNIQDRPAILSLGPDKVENYQNVGCFSAPPISDDIVLFLPGTPQANPGN